MSWENRKENNGKNGKNRGNSRNFWRPWSSYCWNGTNYPKFSGRPSRCPRGKIPTLFPQNHFQFPWSHPRKNSWKSPTQENQGQEFPWTRNADPGENTDPKKPPWPHSLSPNLGKTFPQNIFSSQWEFQPEIPSQIDSQWEFQRKNPRIYLPGAEV